LPASGLSCVVFIGCILSALTGWNGPSKVRVEHVIVLALSNPPPVEPHLPK